MVPRSSKSQPQNMLVTGSNLTGRSWAQASVSVGAFRSLVPLTLVPLPETRANSLVPEGVSHPPPMPPPKFLR